MKLNIQLLFLIAAIAVNASTKVIAHRGYWKSEGSAENSISSLKNAQLIGVYGSELDVHLTTDSVLVVYHDNSIGGHLISSSLYSEIKDMKLSNGEKIPTLYDYLAQALKKKKTKLIIEIKPNKDSVLEVRTAQKAVDLVRKFKLESTVEYISFSLNVCKYLVKYNVKSPVSYLSGDVNSFVTPVELQKLGIYGLDYHYSLILKHPEIIKEANEQKITTNCWTVNELETIKKMIDLKVDFITTNEPVLVQSLLKFK